MKKIIKLISLAALWGVSTIQPVDTFNWQYSVPDTLPEPLPRYTATLDIVKHPNFYYTVHTIQTPGSDTVDGNNPNNFQTEYIVLRPQSTAGFVLNDFHNALLNSPEGIALAIAHSDSCTNTGTGEGDYTVAWQAYSLKDGTKISSLSGSIHKTAWTGFWYIGFLGSGSLGMVQSAPTAGPTVTWYKLTGTPQPTPFTSNIPLTPYTSSSNITFNGTFNIVKNPNFYYTVHSEHPDLNYQQNELIILDNQKTSGFMDTDFKKAISQYPDGIALQIVNNPSVTNINTGDGPYTVSWQAYSMSDYSEIPTIKGTVSNTGWWRYTYISFLAYRQPVGNDVRVPDAVIQTPTRVWYKLTGSLLDKLQVILENDNVTDLIAFINQHPSFNMKKAYPAPDIAPGWAANYIIPPLIAATIVYGAEKCTQLLLMLGLVDIDTNTWTDNCTALSLLQKDTSLGNSRNPNGNIILQNLLIKFGATT